MLMIGAGDTLATQFTPTKFNIPLKSYLPKSKIVFPPFFSDYLKLQGCIQKNIRPSQLENSLSANGTELHWNKRSV